MSGKPDDSEAVLKYKKYRNLYNRLIRVARNRYYGDLFDIHRGDISATWRTLNEIIGKTRDKSNCMKMNIDGKIESDPSKISDKFCEYFTNVGKKCADQIPAAKMPFDHYLRENHRFSFFLDPITPGDVISIISKMKGKTSTGHDQISSKLLKSIRGEIAYPLSVAINKSLESGIVPASLKIAKVIPLYKAKDQQLLTNYRPVSLLKE